MHPNITQAAQAVVASAQQSAAGSQTEHLVLHLLYQLIVILVLTRIVVWISRRFLAQTDVSGEILAGLILGPSLIGALFPDFLNALFVPETSTIFVGLAQTGLILLMFQIGLEFEFKKNLPDSKRAILCISIAGIVAPFLLGYVTAPWFWEQMSEPRPALLAFRLFFAVAMSITAIPVLGRIFMELGLSHSRTAALTIAAAAIDDISGWLILGVVSAVITFSFQIGTLAMHIGGLAAYVAFVMLVVRPVVLSRLRKQMQKEDRLSTVSVSMVLILLLVSAAITSSLGVFAVIGGFILGFALHENRAFVKEWNQRVSSLVNAFFLPIFFAYTGLRTDIGSLTDSSAWIQCGLVCVVAFAGKFGGAYIAARVVGEKHRSALTIGICMNTRGMMELIALNIGYDLGVLPHQMFSMLVMMAMASTFIAAPLIRRLMAAERRPAVEKPDSSAFDHSAKASTGFTSAP